jgi:PQQ-dependent catabolism-associated CXXCW motif protein
VAICLAYLLAPALLAVAEEPERLFSADGYRIASFMAPVPQSLPGAVTVGTTVVRSILEAGRAALVDVLPAPNRPEGLPPSALWMPPERRNIPGSAWLPNVGYGRLSDELEGYFRDNLDRLTGGHLDTKIVIYCLADCWMSWNAARRAVSYGYTAVYWYPDGTTGWEAAGLPLETGVPVPMDQSR